MNLPAAFTIKHKNAVLTVIVDADVLDDIKQWKWSIGTCAGKKYVVRSSSIKNGQLRKTIYLHRYLLGAELFEQKVDHINGDTLDNRRENLRLASNGVNALNRTQVNSNNTSGVRGVAWSKQKQMWRARVKVCNKCLHLGHFNTVEDATNTVSECHKFIIKLSDQEVSFERVRDWRNQKLGCGQTRLRRFPVTTSH